MKRAALTLALLAIVACAAPRQAPQGTAEAPGSPGPSGALSPAGQPPPPVAPPPPGIPPDSLGLAPGSLSSDPAPPPHAENASEPGESPLPSRPFEGAPPVIPHGISDFPPITRDENPCLMCHQIEEKIEGEATPVPRSHYVDMRNTPGTAGSEVTGARYRCMACHLPQTDAAPIVRNRFESR